MTTHSLVCLYALAELPGTAVRSLVKPAIAVHSDLLAIVRVERHTLSYGLEDWQEPPNTHSPTLDKGYMKAKLCSVRGPCVRTPVRPDQTRNPLH